MITRLSLDQIIPLGNIILGHQGNDKTGWRDPAAWLMAAVSDADGIQLTALMTPPHNMTLYATDNMIRPNALNCLINGLKSHKIPGVTTEKELAECFAETYTAQMNLTFQTTMSQRIYELHSVNPDIRQFGNVRLLDEGDMHFVPYWLEAFHAESIYGKQEMSIPQEAEPCRYLLSGKSSTF